MGIEERNIEIIDDIIARVLREKTPQQRLLIAFGLWRAAKNHLTNYLRSEHSDWDEKMIQKRGGKKIISWIYLNYSST